MVKKVRTDARHKRKSNSDILGVIQQMEPRGREYADLLEYVSK